MWGWLVCGSGTNAASGFSGGLREYSMYTLVFPESASVLRRARVGHDWYFYLADGYATGAPFDRSGCCIAS